MNRWDLLGMLTILEEELQIRGLTLDSLRDVDGLDLTLLGSDVWWGRALVDSSSELGDVGLWDHLHDPRGWLSAYRSGSSWMDGAFNELSNEIESAFATMEASALALRTHMASVSINADPNVSGGGVLVGTPVIVSPSRTAVPNANDTILGRVNNFIATVGGSTVTNVLNASAPVATASLQGAAAFVDGAVPIVDPLAAAGAYNRSDPSLQASLLVGGVTRDVVTVIGGGAVGAVARANGVPLSAGQRMLVGEFGPSWSTVFTSANPLATRTLVMDYIGKWVGRIDTIIQANRLSNPPQPSNPSPNP